MRRLVAAISFICLFVVSDTRNRCSMTDCTGPQAMSILSYASKLCVSLPFKQGLDVAGRKRNLPLWLTGRLMTSGPALPLCLYPPSQAWFRIPMHDSDSCFFPVLLLYIIMTNSYHHYHNSHVHYLSLGGCKAQDVTVRPSQ